MNEHLILNNCNLPLNSYFTIKIEKTDDKYLTNYKWPKMKYLFDYSLPITQEYRTDDICKKINNIYQIINIYLPPITKIQYGSKQLAQIYFLKKINVKLSDIHDKIYNNLNLKQLAKILLKTEENNNCYFIYDVLSINHLYLLHHLFKKVYLDYIPIDNSYHVYCDGHLKFDLLIKYQINDIITYNCSSIIFNNISSIFKNKINKLKTKWNKYFLSIHETENIYLLEKVDNYKKFSISISKEIKKRLIEGVKFAENLLLPLSELYLYLDKNNCMIYRLNRFFPLLKNIDNKDFLITEEGLYSISRPKEADMISKKIKQILDEDVNELVIADMTANVGGNVLNFCKYFNHVYAFELKWLNYLILQNNIRVSKFQDKCTVIYGDCLDFFDKYHFDVIFFDPPWGGINYKDKESVNLYLGEKILVDIVIDILSKNLTKLIAIKVPYNYDFSGFKDANIYYNCYKINNMLLVVIQ